MHAWLDADGTRPPIRSALIRFWVRHHILRVPAPLTGAAALRPQSPWGSSEWSRESLLALAAEAADGRQMLMDLERAWFAARTTVAGRRRDSHVVAAIDLLAAVPLLSATTLAKGLGLAIKNAVRLLDSLVTAGVAVEVTHRSKRRLFGLAGMAPLAAAVQPPYRAEPSRGRGRPPLIGEEAERPTGVLPPLSPIQRREFDYSDLEAAMAFADQVTRETRRALAALIRPAQVPGEDRIGPEPIPDQAAAPPNTTGLGNEHETKVSQPDQR